MKRIWKKSMSVMLSAAMAAGTMSGFVPIAVNASDGNMTNQKQFYVSVDGNDDNDGSKEHPFATIEKARQEVDKINDDMTGNIIVNIEAGDYFIDETIQMTKEDSGTNGFEVVYQCDGVPGSARLIGGKAVSGWEKATQEDVEKFDLSADMIGKVYKIQLEENTPDFNTLYVNGERATMARTLNRKDNERFLAAQDEYIFAAAGNATGIAFPEGTLSGRETQAIQNALDRGEEGAQIYAWDWDYRNWMTSTIPIAGISGNWLQFEPSPADIPTGNRPKYPFGGGARFVVQGNLAFLDVPGEYHYNKKENVLYYYPKAGEENLEAQEVIVPFVQEVIHLNGDEKEKVTDVPNPDNQVHHITFKGLEIGYTEFTDSYSSCWNAFDAYGVGVFPEEALQEGITQPSYCEVTERKEFRKGAITLTQTNHITVDSMRIVNTGLSGVNAWGDNDHLTVKNCEIANIGLYGICVDGGYPGPETGCYSYGHLITNNVIHGLGALAGHATGVQIAQVHDSEFSHLEIYDAARRAIGLNGAWANRRAEDNNFNRFRDTHSYNNHLEYLFLHDLQQDGGDDGALFMCTLYGSWGDTTGSRPNYLNQVYMDKVGSSSSNKDFKANCINFDMGCAGVQVSNVKAVNPQHYNVRHDGEVIFDNVNIGYYDEPSNSNYKNFDESKMEYDKIGVDESFPYEDAVTTSVGGKDKADSDYGDLYYRDEFDHGLEDWWKLAGKPETSSLYFSDNDDKIGNSFLADAFYHASTDGCRIGKPFGTDLNKIVEIDFFDHVCDGMENGYCGKPFQWKLDSFARVDDGTTQRAIGVAHNTSGTCYSYRVGNFTKATNVEREYGWHTFKWDYTSGTDVKMYIDNKLIATLPADSFSYVEMGDYGMGGFNAYDNVVIYGGDPAPDPIPLPEPPAPEEPEKGNKTFPGIIEADEADELPEGSQVCDNPNATGGKTVGYLVNGGVFTFCVTVEKAFALPLTVHYGANKVNAGFKVFVDDEEVQDVKFDVAKGWDTLLEYTTKDAIQFTEGEHVVKLVITDNNFGLDWIGFLEEEPVESVSVEKIQPSVQGTLKLAVGNTVKIPYEVFPKNADDKSVTWSTEDDKAVLTVTPDGTITAIGAGKASVTVASNASPEVKTSFEVEVEDAEASLISRPELGCVPSANVEPDHPNYSLDKLIDGKINGSQTGWIAKSALNPEGREDPSAYLSWEEPQTVKTIYLYDLAEGGNYVEQMEIIFNDDVENKIVLENGIPDGGMEKVTLQEAKTGITKIEFHILKAKATYKNYGFEEIKVFREVPAEVPVNSISFGSERIGLFEGGSYTLNPPVVVPSSATNQKVSVTLTEGEDVIRLKENATDGIIRNYTITALKSGTAVIRAAAADGVYKDFTIEVIDREPLADKIIEAESLYGMYPDHVVARKALRTVIDKAIQVYNGSNDAEDVRTVMDELECAMEAFRDAVMEKTDKSLLQKSYDYAVNLSTEGVAESAVRFFEKAKAEALAVLEDTKATQKQIDAAWDKLLKGIWGLGLYQGDKTNLEVLIQKAEEMIQNQDKYVQDKWENLVQALEAGKVVMEDKDAFQEDIEPVADTLLNAILEQRLKANKSNLEELLGKANMMDLSIYTDESVRAFKMAFAEAKAVMEDESLSEEEQEKVDAAVQQLDDVIKGLKLVSNAGKGDAEENDAKDNDAKDSTSGNEVSSSVRKDAPKTGDNANAAVWFIMFVCMAAGIAAMRLRRQSKG